MKRLSNTLIQTITPLLSVFALRQDVCAGVRVVNAAGGAPYTTIQAAVNAAVDGDVILVKPTGTYAGFGMSNKALTVVGDSPSGVNVNGVVAVQNLTATRTLVLANLNVTMPANITLNSTLRALNCYGVSGQLRAQHCTFTGCAGTLIPDGCCNEQGTPGGTGAWIENCSGGVAFEDCTFTGGTGGGYGNDSTVDLGGNAGDGVKVIGARAVLYDCTARGGVGGVVNIGYAGDGGHGMVGLVGWFLPSQLFASNTGFVGGHGGGAESGSDGGFGGDGGHGLWINTGFSAWELDNTFAGGIPGTTLFHHNPGQPGQGILNNGTLITFQPSKVVMTAPALVRAQTQMSFTFAGEPGDEIFLLNSGTSSFIGRVSWRGFLLALPVGLFRELSPAAFATIPGSGQVTMSVSALQLLSGQQGKTVYYQALRKTVSGSKTLGSFAAVTVVAPGF